jgi:hypothetical protein
MLLLFFAVNGITTGEAFGKFGKVDRFSQPFGFWVVVVPQAAFAILLFFLAFRL